MRLRAAAGIVFVAVALCWRWYRRWLTVQTARASSDSVNTQTPAGTVEYSVRGHGPVVLHFHGGNVGHNGGFLLDHVVAAGYQILTPDRPGYLGTPIDNGRAPHQQADLAAALLDTLGIERVAVVGVSAGGPAAIQFAVRHAHRVDALVLLSAISQRTPLSDAQRNSALGRLVTTPRYQNVAYFLIHRAMHHAPALALRDFVRTETTYDTATGARYIETMLADPAQRREFRALADAMVPALPRLDGVRNDLAVQQQLDDLPLDEVRAATLVVGSVADGDIGYANAVNAAERIPNATLITVEQFGHFIWWGSPQVRRDFERRIEALLDRHVRGSAGARQA